MQELEQLHQQYGCLCDETSMYDQFLVVESAEGCHVRFQGDPEPYLDLVMGYSATNFGHRHPRMVQAMHDAVDRIDHIHSFNCEAKIRVSAKLASMVPGTPDVRVYFPVGGAMAIENAIKIARAATGNTKIASFEGAFHGYSYGAMMVTDRAFVNLDRFAPMPGAEIRWPYGSCWPGDPDDADAEIDRRLARIDEFLTRDRDVAAVVFEPVQGANGFVIPEKRFVQGLREITRSHGVLLIDDEIQVGVGRCGRMFAIEHFDVSPDIIVMGKSITAGYYPTSVVIARTELFDKIPAKRSGIGSTFGNNPLGLALIEAVLDMVESERMFDDVERKGDVFTGELRMFERYPFVANVTGLGLAHSFAIVENTETNQPHPALAARIQSEALRQHVLLYVAGVAKNRIKLFLPVTIKREELAPIARRIDGVLAKAVELAGMTAPAGR